jgi:ribonucleoside-triphosphate reductase
VLVTFPVCWDGVVFDKVDGKEVNLESAVTQLERYKLLQTSWNQQNTSVTISYDPSEISQIISWLLDNWDCYVGVSFIYRTDPTKTAKDLGYLYLPQEVVDERTYKDYAAQLGQVLLDGANSFDEIVDAECATGACPIR